MQSVMPHKSIFLYRKILLQKINEKQNIKNTKTIYRNYSTPPPPHNITKYPICTKLIIYILCTYIYTYTQAHPHTYTCINAYKHT